MVARTCITLYGWFPVFGSLRAGLALIHRDGRFLMIDRNDGRGVCLPGGISTRGEEEAATVRREVLEETGLTVTGAELRLRFYSSVDVPCNACVFEVRVSGEIKDSWEGTPRWMTCKELEPRLLESQRPVLELMQKMVGTF